MLRTDCVYRVLYSPTSFTYAVSPDGVGAYFYDSVKQAHRAHGDLPMVIISSDDLDALKDA